MALDMTAFLHLVTKDLADDVDISDETVDALVEKLLAAGIVKPTDLGFLCTGQAGVRANVCHSLGPNMSAPTKVLLGKACALQRPCVASVIDLATLSLSCVAEGAAGILSYPERDSHHAGAALPLKRGKCSATAMPAMASHAAVSTPTLKRMAAGSHPSATTNAGTMPEPAKASRSTSVHPAKGNPASAVVILPGKGQSHRQRHASIAERDEERMEAAIDTAYSLFLEYGKDTDRYRMLFRIPACRVSMTPQRPPANLWPRTKCVAL